MGSELLLPGALLVIGFLLLGVEVLILPGVGLIGLLGLFSLGFGCYFLWTAAGPLVGLVGVVGSLVGSGLVVKLFLRSRAARQLVLDDEIGGVSGPEESLERFVGQSGIVVSHLRPSGVVSIEGGQRLDAVLQDGSYLEDGTEVLIVGHGHGQIYVVPSESSEAPPSSKE
ncbi:MAG: hypothetical protein VYE15_01510 [Myxococcota bacterium]|nr:hypothetical protein [Myxococcota bacterium]